MLLNTDLDPSALPISEQKTEIWYGNANIVAKSLEILYSIQKQYDLCIQSKGPDAILSKDEIRKAVYDLKKRGAVVRIITDITEDNLNSCRELSAVGEIRHLSEVSGNFVIADRNKYGGVADLEDTYPYITEHIHSNVPAFVKQQQYFFEMLWKTAIPLKQRIKEIKEGSKREFIETIQDSNEIIKLLFDLIKSASEEILIIFPSTNMLLFKKEENISKSLKEAEMQRGVKVRLVAEGKMTDDRGDRVILDKNFAQVRYHKKSVQTKIMIFIVDNEFSIAIEINDDRKESLHEAIGLATYSNSESTVFSYVSIFETLWTQAELMTSI